MDIRNVRKYMSAWAKRSYVEGLKFCHGYSAEEIEQAKTILQMQNLTDKMMNGYSVEGIPYKYEGPLRQISYSQVFYDALNEGYLTPVSYMMRLIHECNQHFDNDGLITGIVGRGLRSLPAFLREMDLPGKLADQLEDATCYRSSPEDDIADHTDMYLEYQGERYRIWSYQNTSDRALVNTVSKIRGDRGELSDGIYVLCPFNYKDASQYEDIYGWRLYRSDYAEIVERLINDDKVDDYDEMVSQGEAFMKQYVKTPHVFRKKPRSNAVTN